MPRSQGIFRQARQNYNSTRILQVQEILEPHNTDKADTKSNKETEKNESVLNVVETTNAGDNSPRLYRERSRNLSTSSEISAIQNIFVPKRHKYFRFRRIANNKDDRGILKLDESAIKQFELDRKRRRRMELLETRLNILKEMGDNKPRVPRIPRLIKNKRLTSKNPTPSKELLKEPQTKLTHLEGKDLPPPAENETKKLKSTVIKNSSKPNPKTVATKTKTATTEKKKDVEICHSPITLKYDRNKRGPARSESNIKADIATKKIISVNKSADFGVHKPKSVNSDNSIKSGTGSEKSCISGVSKFKTISSSGTVKSTPSMATCRRTTELVKSNSDRSVKSASSQGSASPKHQSPDRKKLDISKKTASSKGSTTDISSADTLKPKKSAESVVNELKLTPSSKLSFHTALTTQKHNSSDLASLKSPRADFDSVMSDLSSNVTLPSIEEDDERELIATNYSENLARKNQSSSLGLFRLLPRSVCSQTEWSISKFFNQYMYSNQKESKDVASMVSNLNKTVSTACQTEINIATISNPLYPLKKTVYIDAMRPVAVTTTNGNTQTDFVRKESKTTTVQTECMLRNVRVSAKPAVATVDKAVQKSEYYTIKAICRQDKSTQMYEYVTESELYCIEWIHNNLFDVVLNPFHLVADEKIKDASEITCYSSEKL